MSIVARFARRPLGGLGLALVTAASAGAQAAPDLGGGIEDLRIYFAIGWRVAQADRWPAWKDGSEFKARRDQMLARP